MLWLLPLMVVGAVFLGACAGPLPTDLPPGLEVELVSDSSGLLARVEFTGTVEAMAPETWTVSGQTVGITPDTEINGTIAVGDLVKVEGEVGADGVFLAREIMPVLGGGGQPAPEKETFEFFGTIEVMGPDSWTVSGQTVAVTAATEIKGTFVLGDEVKVHALIEADGSFTAVEIGPASAPDMDDFEEGEIEFRALVEEIGAESWLIGGRAVALAAETLIDEGIVVGNLVEVHAFLSADGTLTASKIELEDEEHDEDDFGSPGMEFELRGLVEAIGADSWTVSGQVFLVTSATEIDEGIIVGSMVKVEGFVGQDGTYTAREIKADFEDDGEDHDDGIPGSKFGTSGTVESIGETSWTISGQVFLITPDTEIDEGIVVGSFVKVEAFVAADGSFTAHEIELEDEDESFEDEDEDDGDDFGGGSESDSDHDDDEDEQDNSGHDSEDDD
jgi:primosomal replication protein N